MTKTPENKSFFGLWSRKKTQTTPRSDQMSGITIPADGTAHAEEQAPQRPAWKKTRFVGKRATQKTGPAPLDRQEPLFSSQSQTATAPDSDPELDIRRPEEQPRTVSREKASERKSWIAGKSGSPGLGGSTQSKGAVIRMVHQSTVVEEAHEDEEKVVSASERDMWIKGRDGADDPTADQAAAAPGDSKASSPSASGAGKKVGGGKAPLLRPHIVDKNTPAAPFSDGDDDMDLPRFRFLASNMSMASSAKTSSRAAEALAILREAFTPTQPKRQARLFAGRRRELQRIISAIEEWKAYVVIYGERGYGKSSLANVIAQIGDEGGITTLSCSCTSDTTFEEIFRGFLSDIPLPYRGVEHRRLTPADTTFDALLPKGSFGAKDLTEALRYLTDTHVIFRIDEFDRITDETLRAQLAEAIKSLSDISAQVTFLIVGVAEDLDDLLGMHPSIQRNIVGVHLSLMTEDELRQLINAGEKNSGLRFSPYVKERIIALSRGLPYQAQLLCLHCGQSAINRGSDVVEKSDLIEAVAKVAQIAPPAVERAYNRAFNGSVREVERVIACAAALCACDLYGYFTIEDIANVSGKAGLDLPPIDEVGEILKRLASEEEGGIFKVRSDSRDLQYGFSDPVMRPYILAREASERGLV